MFDVPRGSQLPKIATEDYAPTRETDRFYPDAEIQTPGPCGLDQGLGSRRPNSPSGVAVGAASLRDWLFESRASGKLGLHQFATKRRLFEIEAASN